MTRLRMAFGYAYFNVNIYSEAVHLVKQLAIVYTQVVPRQEKKRKRPGEEEGNEVGHL